MPTTIKLQIIITLTLVFGIFLGDQYSNTTVVMRDMVPMGPTYTLESITPSYSDSKRQTTAISWTEGRIKNVVAVPHTTWPEFTPDKIGRRFHYRFANPKNYSGMEVVWE